VAVSVTQARQRIDKITHILQDGGVDASGCHDDPSGVAVGGGEGNNLAGSEGEAELARADAAAAASASAAASQGLLPVPTLDAAREWPAARHLHTAEQLTEFKEKRKAAHSGALGGQGIVPADQVPLLTVVPGLVRGLEKTAKAAAHFIGGHGGHGGDATKKALAQYQRHNAHQSVHAAARALSSLPLLQYLDHHTEALDKSSMLAGGACSGGVWFVVVVCLWCGW
jgi:hypothetical protein